MSVRRLLVALAATLLAFALLPAPAGAAPLIAVHPVTAGIFSWLGGALLGAFNWTINLASKFLLVTLASFVRMLIPRSWAADAMSVFEWIVAIPNYAGTITSPTGATEYGFAGVNALRDLFQWIGIALLPLTLMLATGRAAIGQGSPIAAPISRVVALGALLASYTWWWSQAAAVIDQLTRLILSYGPVVSGIHQLMAYATEGVALGGWQLVDLGLMGALALELLALIVLKVVIILAGAILYATGPLMIGLVATETGLALARAWLTAVVGLFTVPVLWATVCAVGAVLIGDASSAGPLIAGNSGAGQLLGGVIVAVAGAATLWLCLRLAREASGILRVQLGGQLVSARSAYNNTHTATPSAPAAGRSAAQSVRTFQSRVGNASAAALTAAGPAGAGTAATAGAAARLGRRGLVLGGAQATASLARAGGRTISSRLAPARAAGARGVQPPGRAGAVASRMARAGAASWQRSATPPPAPGAARNASAHPRRRPGQPARTSATTSAAAATRPRPRTSDPSPAPSTTRSPDTAAPRQPDDRPRPAAVHSTPLSGRRSPTPATSSPPQPRPADTPATTRAPDAATPDADAPGRASASSPAPRSTARAVRAGRRTPTRPTPPASATQRPAEGPARPTPRQDRDPVDRPGPAER